MLGENYATNTQLGEIDIMEYKEVNQLQFTELYIILVTLVVTKRKQQLLLMLHQHFIFIKQYGVLHL
jgi:hypothetical protein